MQRTHRSLIGSQNLGDDSDDPISRDSRGLYHESCQSYRVSSEGSSTHNPWTTRFRSQLIIHRLNKASSVLFVPLAGYLASYACDLFAYSWIPILGNTYYDFSRGLVAMAILCAVNSSWDGQLATWKSAPRFG